MFCCFYYYFHFICCCCPHKKPKTYWQRSCGRLQKRLLTSLNACSLPFVCVEPAALVLATWLPLVSGILTNVTQADSRCACIRGFSCFCNLPWLWQPPAWGWKTHGHSQIIAVILSKAILFQPKASHLSQYVNNSQKRSKTIQLAHWLVNQIQVYYFKPLSYKVIGYVALCWQKDSWWKQQDFKLAFC